MFKRLILKAMIAAVSLASSNPASAQVAPKADEPALTPYGRASIANSRPYSGIYRDRWDGSADYPMPTCMFPRGLCGAIDRDGKVVVPPRYDWVGKFFDGRAAVRNGGVYGYVDETGREVVPPTYDIAGDFKFGFAEVDVGGKSTVIDRAGKQVFEPKFGSIRAIAPDRFEVSETRRIGGRPGAEDFSGLRTTFTSNGGISVIGTTFFSDDRFGVIDLSGGWIYPPGAARPRNFEPDDPSVIWAPKDKLWGLARADGSWIIEPKFTHASFASDGLAQVYLNGKVGFIEKTGRMIIEPVFERAGDFVSGQAPVQRNGISGVIDKTGAWVFQATGELLLPNLQGDFGKQRTLAGWNFRSGDRYGLRDLTGRVILEAQFSQAVNICSDGRLIGRKDGKWFVYRSDGTPLHAPDSEVIGANCGSKPPFAVREGAKFGTIDADGKRLLPVVYDALLSRADGSAIVKLDGKWGHIGSDGRWLLEPRFDYLAGGTKHYVAGLGGLRGILRPDQTWLIEPRYEAAALRGADTAVVTEGGKTGLLRLSDQSWVIPPRHGVMCSFNDILLSKSERHRALFDNDGRLIFDVEADLIHFILTSGVIPFRRDGKWGFADTAGTIVVEPKLDTPNLMFNRGMAWVKQGQQWCQIDRRGEIQNRQDCRAEDPEPRPSGSVECMVEN